MKFSKVSFKNFRKAAVLKQLAVVAIVAILANMYIEIFARFSVVKAIQFFVSKPCPSPTGTSSTTASAFATSSPLSRRGVSF